VTSSEFLEVVDELCQRESTQRSFFVEVLSESIVCVDDLSFPNTIHHGADLLDRRLERHRFSLVPFREKLIEMAYSAKLSVSGFHSTMRVEKRTSRRVLEITDSGDLVDDVVLEIAG
jgi:hypothetical protein